MAPPGKERKYARQELERRFLIRDIPDRPCVASTLITDRYITDTHLRLRRMVTGDRTYYKLTQKLEGLITTIYLDELEYRVCSGLASVVIEKTRMSIPPYAVDVFQGPLAGLFIAEAEFGTAEEMTAFVPADFVVAEVTDDARFAGGNLVLSSREDVVAALAEYGITS